MKRNFDKYLVVSNGTILTPTHEIKEGIVVIQGQKIVDVGKQGEVEKPKDAKWINAGGNYITPGMVDIHVHGAMGVDITQIKTASFSTLGSFFTRHGVTSYLATALTSTDSVIIEVLEHVRGLMKRNTPTGAEILGVHMEGPYLSPDQSGAHPSNLLSLPKPSHYKQFIEYSDVLKIMTLAPELDGSQQLVRDLKRRDIVAAAGHTNGIYREIAEAIDAGITHATHSFCNMSSFRRDNLKRVAGAAETLLYDDRVTGELIGDGWHLGAILMNLIVKVKGVDRVCFVTDAMPATGLPDGKHFLGEVEAIVENGIARLPDNTAYAGSVTTMDVCLRNGVALMRLPFMDALQMCTLTPAKIIKADGRKGSIKKGKDADLMIIDKEFNVIKTIVRGELVYSKV